jgi:Tat protein secretion system quality control protein TatD with DNase activity
VADELARIKGLGLEELAAATSKNFERVFPRVLA